MPGTFRYIIQLLFGIVLVVYGTYVAFGAIRNYKPFIESYKRLDLIKLFGDFGRVLYAIVGFVVSVTGVIICKKQVGNLLA